MTKCSACSGSGYYDNTGSPPCGACDGTGYTGSSFEDWFDKNWGSDSDETKQMFNIWDLREAFKAGKNS